MPRITPAEVVRVMLDANAVRVDTKNSFVWSSGLVAPLYCDHRLLFARPHARSLVSMALVDRIMHCFPERDGIAGVSLAAIPWAAWVSHIVSEPLLVVRPEPKGHGHRRQVEGDLEGIARVVIVEDVISTGSSTIAVHDALSRAGVSVVGVCGILDYQISGESLQDRGLTFHSLYTYSDLRATLGEAGRLSASALSNLDQWYDGLNGRLR